jgi:hypothetical protein
VASVSGQLDTARAEFDAVCIALRALGEHAITDLAGALLARGELELEASESQRAAETLREAVALEEKTQGPAWQLAVARERLGESLAIDRLPEASGLLRDAERVLAEQLGARHSETLRARRMLARLNPGVKASKLSG